MALTKDERRALEYARERIAKGGDYYICNRLDQAAENAICSCAESERIQAHIQKLLEYRSTLYSWQILVGFPDRGADQRRADRLAWIDWMLGKPLPGEAVEIKWKAVGYKVEECEYCGRSFRVVWAEFQQRYLISELKETGVVAAFAVHKRDEVDAAIVAHVWPAEKSEVV